MNKDSKKFYKECRSLFCYYGKNEKKYMKKLANDLLSEENLTYNEIIERFGTPKDIIIDYYEQEDLDSLISNAVKLNYIKKIVNIFIVIILYIAIYNTVQSYKEYEYFNTSGDFYYTEEIH